MMSEYNLHSLTGAYVLNALDDHERLEFDWHLDNCLDCREEVAELGETAARLAAVTEEEPPSSLREAVFRDVRQIRPLPPTVPSAVPAAAPSQPTVPSAVPSAQPARHRTSRRRTVTRILGAVAAVLVLIGGAAVVTWQPWTSQSSAPSAGEHLVEKVLLAPDAQRVTADVPDNGTVSVVRSRSVGRAVILAPEMKPAPAGKDFELWLQKPESGMEPAGLMPHSTAAPVLLDGDAADATAVGITVEPRGGSAEPTSDPIALFDLGDSSS